MDCVGEEQAGDTVPGPGLDPEGGDDEDDPGLDAPGRAGVGDDDDRHVDGVGLLVYG